MASSPIIIPRPVKDKLNNAISPYSMSQMASKSIPIFFVNLFMQGSFLVDQVYLLVSCEGFSPFAWLAQKGGLALLRDGNQRRYLFVGPPIFCCNNPAGKPTDNRPSNEPNNEFDQFHIFYPFMFFHNTFEATQYAGGQAWAIYQAADQQPGKSSLSPRDIRQPSC